MTTLEEKKQLVQDFLRAMGTKDLELYASCITPDCIVWSAGEAWYSGDHTMERLRKNTAAAHNYFPNGLQFTVTNMIAEGDQVAAETKGHADHISGKVYANTYFMLFKFRDGKICNYKEYMDTELANQFLGKDEPLVFD